MSIYRQKEEGVVEQIAEGYERTESLSAVVDGKTINWIERRLVIRSLQQAEAKAQAALEALNEHKQGKAHFREVGP
jgi:acetolactate synthase small subunit